MDCHPNNSGYIRIQTEVLGHSLVHALICLHHSLVHLLCPACFACALLCANLFARSLTPSLVRECIIWWLSILWFLLFWTIVVCELWDKIEPLLYLPHDDDNGDRIDDSDAEGKSFDVDYCFRVTQMTKMITGMTLSFMRKGRPIYRDAEGRWWQFVSLSMYSWQRRMFWSCWLPLVNPVYSRLCLSLDK